MFLYTLKEHHPSRTTGENTKAKRQLIKKCKLSLSFKKELCVYKQFLVAKKSIRVVR